MDGSTKEECKMERRIGLHHPQMLPQQKWLMSRFLVFSSSTFSRPFRAQNFSERERLDSTSWASRRPFGPSQYLPAHSKLVQSHLGHVFGHTIVTCLCANLGLTPSWVRQSGRIDTLIFTFNYCATFSSHRVACRGLGNARWTHQF